MKLVISILLLTVSAFGQAIYTATTSGNWKSAGTWTYTGTPCSTSHWPTYNGDTTSNTTGTACGDVAIINTGITVTCASGTCSVGNSPGTAFAITSVAVTTGVYTGTITGGASNAYANHYVSVTGLTGAGAGTDNGTFLCTASTATTLTLQLTTAANTSNGLATLNVLTALGTGNLTVASGARFIYAGTVKFTSGLITIGSGTGGATLNYDSSYSANATTVNYTFDCTAVTCTANAPKWAINGTSGSHAVIEGDSYKNTPYASTTTCTAANQCLAGAFNYDGNLPASTTTFSGANQGSGTIHYLDIMDVAGSGVNAHGSAAWITSVLNSASAFDHITVFNSGTIMLLEQANATQGLTISSLAVTSSIYPASGIPSGTNPSAYGCLDIRVYGATSAAFSLSNAYFDCVTNYLSTGAGFGIWTFRNVEWYRSPFGSNPGQYIGVDNGALYGPTDVFDEMLIYTSGYTNTTWVGSNTMRPLIPTCSVVNSVFFNPKTTTSSQHMQIFTGNFAATEPARCATSVIKNTVFGQTGNNAVVVGSLLSSLTSILLAFTQIPQNTTVTASNNVELCDQIGYASMGFPYGKYGGASPTPTHTFNVTLQNDTNCSGVSSGLTNVYDWSGANGAAGFESGAVVSSMMSINSNIFWNPLNHANAEVCDTQPGSAVYTCPASGGTTCPILLVTNNANINTNINSIPPACDSGDPNDPIHWIATGPQNDVVFLNKMATFVDVTRSVITFDCDYLVPAGVLPSTPPTCAAYWPTQAGWRAGGWVSGTVYAKGDIVSDQQSGVWNGKTTYWRCIVGHTAAAATRPSTGVDTTNMAYDYNQVWEPAYMQLFRQAVYNGTVYTEGAVPVFTDINGNPEPMHIIGLLNSWLRQGRKTLEPTLWRGCPDTLTSNGTALPTQKWECGNAYAIIKHIYPPAITN